MSDTLGRAARVLVVYYSATGHVHALAKAVAEGAEQVGADVRLRHVEELAPEMLISQNQAWGRHRSEVSDEPTACLGDLEWADGIAFGTPTRFGNVAAQLKMFVDQAGQLWEEGKLINKVMTAFTSSQTDHGGQESTILALANTFYHWGAIVLPLGYTVHEVFAGGGNPYGASFTSGIQVGPPDPEAMAVAVSQGRRLARVARVIGLAQERGLLDGQGCVVRPMATNRLHEIEAQGTAIWIDTLSRELLDEGTLERLIADDGVTGVTSNPTIFKKAMEDSERYDQPLREAIAETTDPRQVYFRVAFADTRDACDLLRPVFERTEGRDGYASFELPPDLAYDVEGSVDAAGWCRDEINRPNVLIKVPGTEQGVRAFEELTARGLNVNVTLLFSVLRYEEIAEAYLRGLERRVEKGQPIDRSASVASFFVSRVDTKIDPALEELGRPELRGMAAVANAKLAYASFARMFSGERWQALQARGAHVQRPLWASTSTKNPAYPDTLYVDELIGPDTVSTMPDATLDAARDHATAERSIDRDVEQACAVLEQIRRAGVDVDEITRRQLVDEGVKAFAGSFEAMIDTIEGKITQPSPSSPPWIQGGAR